MTLSLGLQVAEVAVVLVGVVGALFQLHQMQVARQRESAITLLQSFISPEFARSFHMLASLPNGLTVEQVEALPHETQADIFLMGTTIESIGILAFRGELELDIVDDFYSGAVILYWRKFATYFAALRQRNDRVTIAEWCEWLYDQMYAREANAPAVPAYVQHKNWTPHSPKKKSA